MCIKSSGKMGRVYNDDPPVGDKLKVYLDDGGKRLVCFEKLEVRGHFD